MAPAGKLIVCPTPLGNLGDMTKRAIDALSSADTVCAEDTRVTGKLLAAFSLKKRLERLDENRIGRQLESIVSRIREGEVIAYCSDAGMPGVSDPGARLVAAARAAGVAVEVLPGPSAAITAYVASGFSDPRYYFGGFFPRKQAEGKALLDSLRPLEAVLLFYESPNRLVASLETIAEAFPQRSVAVCRELTKLHEEVFVGLSNEVFREFSQRAAKGPIKGEIVIVVDAPNKAEAAASQEDLIERAKARAEELKAQGGLSGKDIRRRLSEEFDLPRNVLYELAVI